MVHLTTTLLETSQERRWRWEILLAWGMGIGLLLSTFPARATEAQVSWECSGYSGEAQTRCVQTLIEIQREKIAKLEGELQAQQARVNQLKEQASRQAAAPPVTATPGPYASPYTHQYRYTYWYPPAGFSLYFGRPWIYGPPYYYGPSFSFRYGPRLFYGPRFHRHR